MLQDDYILSRLHMLKDKDLLCCTDSNNVPLIDTDIWSMTCHTQVLLYLINIFEDERAESFYKLSRFQWASTQCILANADGTYLRFFQDPEALIFPYEEQCGGEYLYEDPGKCYKNVVNKCLCRRCRKIVYDRYNEHPLSMYELYHFPPWNIDLNQCVSLPLDTIHDLMKRSGEWLKNDIDRNPKFNIFPHYDENILPDPLKFNRAGRI